MNTAIGIDVSKHFFDLAVSSKSGATRFDYSPAGLRSAARAIAAAGPELIAMEASGGYERRLAAFLREISLPVAVVNPRRIRDFARAAGCLAKNDRIDAEIVAHYAAVLQPAPQPAAAPQAVQLKALNARRRQLIEMRTAEKNRMEHADDRLTARSIKAVLKVLERQIAEVDEAMKRTLESDEGLREKAARLKSVPGIGEASAQALLTELPELGCCNRRQVASLLGLAPICRDSGTFRGKRMTGGGRRELRTQLYMPTLVAIQHNPVIRDFYQRLVAAGKPRMAAVVASMRKLIVILNTMIKNNQYWKTTSA